MRESDGGFEGLARAPFPQTNTHKYVYFKDHIHICQIW